MRKISERLKKVKLHKMIPRSKRLSRQGIKRRGKQISEKIRSLKPSWKKISSLIRPFSKPITIKFRM